MTGDLRHRMAMAKERVLLAGLTPGAWELGDADAQPFVDFVRETFMAIPVAELVKGRVRYDDLLVFRIAGPRSYCVGNMPYADALLTRRRIPI